jgi:drug/metabolite transporter (DMT)-like permease
MEPGSTERSESNLRIYALLVVMVTIWAVNFIVAKVVLREIPPMLTAGVRAILAGSLMLGVYLIQQRRNRTPRTWRSGDVPLLLLLGVAGVAGNQLLFVLGIARTSVAHAAIIIGLMPVMVLLMSAAAGHQRLSAGELVGMGVALGGVATIQLARTAASGTVPTIAGDLLVLLSALCFAMFTVGGKRLASNHDSITVNTFAYAGGALVLLPVTLWLSRGFHFERVSASAYTGLAYMALFSSVAAYLIYCHCLRFIPAPRVSAFHYFQPLIATLLAVPFLGERPTGALAAGGLLVLTGVLITERT